MKKVAIIGGGFAGSTVAKKLEKDNRFKVILIDTKEYFEFTPAVLRTIVEPNHIEKIKVKHRYYLTRSEIVIGKVSGISDKDLKVNGKNIEFDYLVIASGSSYNKPIKEQMKVIASARSKTLKESNKSLEKAKKVVVCGGGLVGVELIAEIASHYRDKNLVLLHSGSRLLEKNNWKSGKYSERFLKNRGVKIIFKKRVKGYSKRYISCVDGEKIKAEMVFLAVGIKPNFDFMKKNFKDKLDSFGFIKVNNFLQLEGYKNIFVAGDVASIKEEKLAQNAEKQAEVVIHNIKRVESGEKELCIYKNKKKPMIISLGKWDGIFEYGSFVFTGIIPGIMKRFVEMREVMLKKKVL